MSRIRKSGTIRVMVRIYLVLGLCLTVFAKRNTKPHIIFILADDMGWNDVGFHGMTDIPTPNIDALAADSVVLNNYYSASLCTPSRASLLTGRYTSSIGMYEHVILNGEPWGLPLDIKLLPEYLNELGYDSHIVGKWHLGNHHRQYTPTYRGFQTHYGIWHGGVDFFNQQSSAYNYSVFSKPDGGIVTDDEVVFAGKDFVDQLKPIRNRKEKYLTDLFTRRAKKIIQRHDTKRPLFLFLSHHGVHRGNLAVPLRGPKNETEKFLHFADPNKRNFAGALTSLDSSLGTIFNALESKDMLENTVLAFVSDNGAALLDVTANLGSNWPLRGQKGSPYEGGIRMVAMVWSQRFRQRPYVKNGLFHVTDWMPTLYRLAGGKVSNLGSIEGVDQTDFLTQDEVSARREVLITINTLQNVTAIRNDRFKLVKWGKSGINRDWTEFDNRRTEERIDEPWTNSEVHKVLRRFYEKQGKGVGHMQRPLVEVECNRNKGKIEPLSGTLMLFDLEEDPCELNNIADQHPKVVSHLLKRMEHWKNQAAPLVAKKYIDVRSNPMHFNGHWSIWLDSNRLNSSVPYC